MGQQVLAIDQGTTGTTALVFDGRGRVTGRAYSEFRQHYPRAGWIEHDPEEIWKVTLRVARGAMRKARVTAKGLAGIGITNQRETTVLWDRKTGKPIHRAIVWQDRRTSARCDELKQRGLIETVRHKTGLVIDPYFSATKIGWLLEHVKGARKRAGSGDLLFGTIDTWLVWKLTGGRVHATDYTNASRTLLFDIRQKRWDPDLLEVFGVPSALLPQVVPSSGVIGETEPKLFGRALPIAGIAGDQQAALFGQGCFRPGYGKNTYGTGAFVVLPTGAEPVFSTRGLLTTLACGDQGQPIYALEGSIFVAGAAIQWLRDGLGLVKKAAETEKIARSVKDNLGVYLVPAFTGLGAPHWDPEARGALVGLTLGATRAHVTRAALEAMAYQTRDVVEAMVADSGKPLRSLRADGGASQNDWLMQFQADILNTEVDRPKVIETTAMGAAFLAGLATGVWKSAADLEKVRKVDKVFRPKMKKPLREDLYQGWRDAVARVRTK